MRYLIRDVRLGKYEQDEKEYTLDELKEYFKVDLANCNEEDEEYFKSYNIELSLCEDVSDIDDVLNKYWNDYYYTFKEVQ